MGRELLLASPTFHSSIQDSARIVQPLGIELLDCFNSLSGWDEPVASSIGLAAVQVCLAPHKDRQKINTGAHFWVHSMVVGGNVRLELHQRIDES